MIEQPSLKELFFLEKKWHSKYRVLAISSTVPRKKWKTAWHVGNQKENWYIKWCTWYNSFIKKLINHECIDNKRNYKSISSQHTSTFANFIKHLLECKLIHFLNVYRLMFQLVAISSEITFVICYVTHLIIIVTKVRLELTTFKPKL